MDPTRRFSNRVENYVRYRPGYPLEIVTRLEKEAGLSTGQIVADIGSGTGKLSELLLRRGYSVIGVEPNKGMRQAAERLLSGHLEPLPRGHLPSVGEEPAMGERRKRRRERPRFYSVDGTAEVTSLPPQSVRAILAGQAFHWFDAAKSRLEFIRILAPGGLVALLWNQRRRDATAFLQELEAALCRYCPEYPEIGHRDCDREKIATFFSPNPFHQATFPNSQRLDGKGLLGRLLSASYVPMSGPQHEALVREVQAAFRRHETEGQVTILYDTQLFWGRLESPLSPRDSAP